MKLPLDQIQGNITPGFRKDHQAFLFFQWTADDKHAVQAWIKAIKPHIASGEEVATYNQLFRLVKSRLPKGEAQVLHSTWVNVAFSARGLKLLLSEDDMKQFPAEFTAEPGTRIGEVDDPAARASFEFGGNSVTVPDAIVLIGADTLEDLHAAIVRQLQLANGLRLMLPPYIGEALGDRREHFGFRDSISQPDPEDPLKGWDEERLDGPVVKPGEFILGLDREQRPLDPAARAFPDWAKHGSYLVFRKLRQHVDRFEHEVEEAMAAVKAVYDKGAPGPNADRAPLLDPNSPELMRAKLVGRWPSGQKLTDLATPPPTSDPGAGLGRLSDLSASAQAIKPGEFDADKYGGKCPLSSHIRKAHPRDLPEARHHRIIRRGITFGPPAVDRTKDDGQERGIFFLAYQASIADQFEFIQRQWLNAPEPAELQQSGSDLPGDVFLASIRTPGWDPVAAIRRESPLGLTTEGQMVLQLWENGAFERITFPTKIGKQQPVTVHGTGYFLAPSIEALGELGG